MPSVLKTVTTYCVSASTNIQLGGGLHEYKFHAAGFLVISWRPRHEEWYSWDNSSLFNLATAYGCHTIRHGSLNTCVAQQNELRIANGLCCFDQNSDWILTIRESTDRTDGWTLEGGRRAMVVPKTGDIHI